MRTSDCRSSLTANKSARRPCGSTSCRAHCACACAFRASSLLLRAAARRRRTGALGELVDLALERRDPLLELVDSANALLHLVDPVAHGGHRADDAIAAGGVLEAVHRLLAQLTELAQQVWAFFLRHADSLRERDWLRCRAHA